ncbi:MAG: hypothetical protein Q9205_006288 [Flavoplaca limonia]
MATQEDGLDSSQLKDIILSSAPEVQADAVAELLQREKEQPDLRQNRPQSVSPIKPNELSDTVKSAQNNPSPIGAFRPPNTSDHASHAPVRLTASQPEPPNTIADSTETRMNLLGSQSQGDTQPISQWAVEAWTNNRTRELQSAARLSSNGISTGDNSTEKTYLPGRTGHVDLMAFVKNPSTLDDDGLSADGEVEDDPTSASQPQDIRAELFPESQRFRPPKTPASHNKKRKRDPTFQGDASSFFAIPSRVTLRRPFYTAFTKPSRPSQTIDCRCSIFVCQIAAIEYDKIKHRTPDHLYIHEGVTRRKGETVKSFEREGRASHA